MIRQHMFIIIWLFIQYLYAKYYFFHDYWHSWYLVANKASKLFIKRSIYLINTDVVILILYLSLTTNWL